MAYKTFEDFWKEHENHTPVSEKCTKPKGSRCQKDDLSNDYPPNLKNMGKVYPFKVLGKGKKS